MLCSPPCLHPEHLKARHLPRHVLARDAPISQAGKLRPKEWLRLSPVTELGENGVGGVPVLFVRGTATLPIVCIRRKLLNGKGRSPGASR